MSLSSGTKKASALTSSLTKNSSLINTCMIAWSVIFSAMVNGHGESDDVALLTIISGHFAQDFLTRKEDNGFHELSELLSYAVSSYQSSTAANATSDPGCLQQPQNVVSTQEVSLPRPQSLKHRDRPITNPTSQVIIDPPSEAVQPHPQTQTQTQTPQIPSSSDPWASEPTTAVEAIHDNDDFWSSIFDVAGLDFETDSILHDDAGGRGGITCSSSVPTELVDLSMQC